MDFNKFSTQEQLDRLKWMIYGVAVAYLTIIEIISMLRGIPFIENFLEWLLYAGGVGIVIETAFWRTKKMQAALDEELKNSQRHFQQIVSLHTATSALLMTHNLHELLEQVLDASINAIPAAEAGTIYLANPETGVLNLEAVHGTKHLRSEDIDNVDVFVFASERGYAERVIQTKEAILVTDIKAAGENITDDAIRTRSLIVAPLVLENQGVGVLALVSSVAHAFTDIDLASLTTFATTAAAAILNARLYEEAHYLAITDVLTGLNNRRYFFELAELEFKRAKRYNRALSLLMIDLDHFKVINDRYGHTIGDLVLQAVAQRCKDKIREQDIIGRYGGEEFSVILPEADEQAARRTANRLRACIADDPFQVGNDTAIHLTISIGVASLQANTEDLTGFLNIADAALYKAKESGKNCIAIA